MEISGATARCMERHRNVVLEMKTVFVACDRQLWWWWYHYERYGLSTVQLVGIPYGTFPLPIRSIRSSWSPKFPDQARPTTIGFVHTTSSRRYSTAHEPHTTTNDLSTISTRQPLRSLLDIKMIVLISTRSLTQSLLDQLLDHDPTSWDWSYMGC